MATFPTFLAGNEPTADDFFAILPVFAYKTADESVTSSTTLQNDDVLFVAGIANAIYVIDTLFRATGAGSSVNGNVKFAWTFPTSGSGQSLYWGASGMATNDISGATAEGKGEYVSYYATTSPSTAIPFGTPSTNYNVIVGRGLWVVGSVAGTLQLQWAQNSSSGTATTVATSSHIKLTRVV